MREHTLTIGEHTRADQVRALMLAGVWLVISSRCGRGMGEGKIRGLRALAEVAMRGLRGLFGVWGASGRGRLRRGAGTGGGAAHRERSWTQRLARGCVLAVILRKSRTRRTFTVKVLRVRDERSHRDEKSPRAISYSPWLETASSFGRPRSVARCRRCSESARMPGRGGGVDLVQGIGHHGFSSHFVGGRRRRPGRPGRSDWTHIRD